MTNADAASDNMDADVVRYKREVGRIFLGDRFINLEMLRDRLCLALRAVRKGGRMHRRGARDPRETPRLVGGPESGAAVRIPAGEATARRIPRR